MSPAPREAMAARPARLKIHKDSHNIQKPSSSSSSSSSTAVTNGSSISHARHHPVIIYTHSPKVIHTQARDFMALVQKLTGLSHSDDNEQTKTPPPPPRPTPTLQDHDESSSSSESYIHLGCSPFTSTSVSSSIFNGNPVRPLEGPFDVPLLVPSYRCPGATAFTSMLSIEEEFPTTFF
ncbi:VQ domain-containing protein [Dioscorea alata]|uniref:VQ domain-containing protein n=1 Tax=Dioscorea alata TaxID=55571 RepID=A0ACB7W5A7_DIOAL|nr:VQ domain-containing protein [Dioscorea alata]